MLLRSGLSFVRRAVGSMLAAALFASGAVARAQPASPTRAPELPATAPQEPGKPEPPEASHPAGAPSTPEADAAHPAKEAPPAHEGGFEFGSYGRVYAASDLRGGLGRGTNIVAFGPRIADEGSYGELELR